MKNIVLFFMLLLIGCDMSTSVKYNQEQLALYSLVINNNVNNTYYSPSSDNSSKPTTLNCSVDCLGVSNNYDYVDYPSNINGVCTDNFMSGDGNGSVNQGEKAVLRVPLTYYGNSIITNIQAELISLDSSIVVSNSIIRYPNMRSVMKQQFSCPNSYYEEWRDSTTNNISCFRDNITACTGWRITIPNNYNGRLNFKILVRTNSGDKLLNYSL